jgi:hypothetical protein
VVAVSLIAVLLLAVPVILVALLGLVLALASRGTRAPGLVILAILGALLVVPVLLVGVWLQREDHFANPDVPPAADSAGWISVEEAIVPAVATDEPASASFVSRADAGTDDSADAEAVEPSAAETVGATADAATVESETAEAESVSSSKSAGEAISRALFRAIGDSSPPTDDPSTDAERDAVATSAAEAPPSEDAIDEAVSSSEATDSNDIVADYRPTGPDRAEMAKIRRYLDEVESSGRIVSDVDAIVPGAILPSEPPPWINMAAFNIDDTVYRPVASGPYATRDECRRALAEAMKRAVDEYVDEYHGRPEAAGYVDIDLAYIKTHLRRGDVYQERLQASFGPMIQQHALLEFRRDFREEIERRWNQAKVTSRLAHVGLAAVAILAGLATIFAYLRLDTATKGYYSGRLQIAAGAVILGLVALGILTARWIPWL